MVLAIVVAWLLLSASAKADDVVFEGSDDAFDHLRDQAGGGVSSRQETVEDAIGRFYRAGEVDDGTIPPSEVWDNDFSFRESPPPTLGYNGRLFFRYSDDDISDVEKWEKEFELNLNYGDWRGYLRGSDYNSFAYNNDPFRLEKSRLVYRGDDYKVTLGSYGALFGRGLMVSMFEERFLDFDNEIEGAKVEYEVGDADITALWGTRKERDLPHHAELAAARLQYDVNDELTVGIQAGQTEFPYELSATPEDPQLLEYDLLGATAEYRNGPFYAYGETVRVKRPEYEYGDMYDISGENGRGHYLNLGLNFPGAALSAEFKDYKGISQPFIVLPAVRKWEEQAAAEPNDDKGYLFDLTLSPLQDGSYFEFSYGQGNSHMRDTPHTEFGAIYNSPATNRLSYVLEYWKVNHTYQHHTIYGADVSYNVTDDLTATGIYEHERQYDDFTDLYVDNRYIAELAYKSLVNLIYTREETGNEFAETTEWDLYELKLRPDELQELNIVYGARREGFVCSGGVCRLEPAFDGIKIDYLFRF